MNAPRSLAVVGLIALAMIVVVFPTVADAAGTVEVQVVPPTPGVRLLIDDQEVITGADGRAMAYVADQHAARIRAAKPYSRISKTKRARVGSIVGGGAVRTLRLELEYLMRFTFATMDGDPVRNSSIEALSLRSSTGIVKRFKPTKPVWLQGVRVAPLNGVPTPKDVWWNVDDVQVRGTTVVNRAQQRFEPSTMGRDRVVDVQLLFFDASVRVRDAFFGWPVGGELVVQHPDGLVERLTLDGDGKVDLGDVPRGQYQMAVDGPGLKIARPITITRDIDDELRFYSWLDVGMFATFIILFLYGLVAVGARRTSGRNARRPSRLSSADAVDPSIATSRMRTDEKAQFLRVNKKT